MTLFLEEPIDGEGRVECTDVKLIGGVVWATPADDPQEVVVPLTNVTAVRGDAVEQTVEALEAPGGQFTELVTDIS